MSWGVRASALLPSTLPGSALLPTARHSRSVTQLYVPPRREPPCLACADQPTTSMLAQNLSCTNWANWSAWDVCQQNVEWRRTFACRLSCYKAELAYDGVVCCAHTPPAPPPPPPAPPYSPSRLLEDSACQACPDLPSDELRQRDQSCDALTNNTRWWTSQRCRHNQTWREHKYCQFSCYWGGGAYANDTCCSTRLLAVPRPPVSPSPAPPAPPSPPPTVPCFVKNFRARMLP